MRNRPGACAISMAWYGDRHRHQHTLEGWTYTISRGDATDPWELTLYPSWTGLDVFGDPIGEPPIYTLASYPPQIHWQTIAWHIENEPDLYTATWRMLHAREALTDWANDGFTGGFAAPPADWADA